MQCAVEAFLVAEILKSHDSDHPQLYGIKGSTAFQVRNMYRIFVQNMNLSDRLYHMGFQVSHNRWFYFFSQFPGAAGTHFRQYPATRRGAAWMARSHSGVH